jgi:hypothetical protein
MKKFLIGTVMALTLLLGSGLAASPALAAPTDAAKDNVCQGVSGTGSNCGAGGAELSTVMKAVLNIMSVIAGIAAIIMIVVGGLKYITSEGDAQAVSSAKRTIIYALVGLVVVAAAQTMVRYVLKKV